MGVIGPSRPVASDRGKAMSDGGRARTLEDLRREFERYSDEVNAADLRPSTKSTYLVWHGSRPRSRRARKFGVPNAGRSSRAELRRRRSGEFGGGTVNPPGRFGRAQGIAARPRAPGPRDRMIARRRWSGPR